MRTDTTNRVTPLREDPALSGGEEAVPPSNTEAEQALLGAILVNNVAYSRVVEFLMPEHFANAVHGRIYAAIGKLIDRGQVADPVILKSVFERDGSLVAVGGAQYLARLAESAVTIINAEHYGRALHDLYVRRELIEIGRGVVTDAYHEQVGETGSEQIEAATEKLYALADSAHIDRKTTVTGAQAGELAIDAAKVAYQRPGTLAGLSSGIASLDRILGGFVEGDFDIVGARPSQGKSTLLRTISASALREGRQVLFFSGEMSARQQGAGFLAMLSGISTSRQRRGDLDGADWPEIIDAQRVLASWPLIIDDGPMILSRIRRRIRESRRKEKILVLIDYIQLMRLGGDDSSESRNFEVGRISTALKRTAVEFDVPVIAASALSREVERRDDKRPMMSDLRNAGELEQDADSIMLLYRHETYLSKAEPQQRPNEGEVDYSKRHAIWSSALEDSRGRAEIHIPKNRHDRPGTARVRFDGGRGLFYDPQDEGDLL